MQVTELQIRNLRCLPDATLALQPGLNFIAGDNGAGKTSILEALHLLAYGRSFRGRVSDGLIRTGQEAVEVFARWNDQASGRERKVGLRHEGQRWQGRLDGEPAAQLGQLCAALAVVSFEPGSHALVDGSADVRRRFLDWGLFHVEQDFQQHWRRYTRALKQRNALLKQRASGSQLDAWDAELADAGELLTRSRDGYVQTLGERLVGVSQRLAPALAEPSLLYVPGWRREQLSLGDALLLARGRDLDSGHTSVGPHRADWRLAHASRPAGEALSRGQAKLAALSCLLTQAAHLAEHLGQWPVVVLDDLASELDQTHQARLLDYLQDCGAQVIISGTDLPNALADHPTEVTRFHVEHGVVTQTPL